MPLFHIAGAGWGIICLHDGAHIVLLREVDLAARSSPTSRGTASRTRCSCPRCCRSWSRHPGVENTDFSSLDTILYGASPISEDVLVKSIDVFGCRFLQAYGLTETSGAVVLLPPEDHDVAGPNAHRLRAAGHRDARASSSGSSTPTATDCAVGEVGEVWIRSPSNMDGLLEHAGGDRGGRSRPTAGSARATPATSTPTATSTSTTASRT